MSDPTLSLRPDQRIGVYISSTFQELAAERVAARRAVEQLGMAPMMIELGARPVSPEALWRAYLEQSQIFVGIYWQRYGWVGPGKEISGLEEEYRLSGDLLHLLYVKTPAPDRDPRLSALLNQISDDDAATYTTFSTANELKRLLVDDLRWVLTNMRSRLQPSTKSPIADESSVQRADSDEQARQEAQEPDGDMAASPPVAPGRIFISYRRAETAYPTGWLYERLANHFGREDIVRDLDSIAPGDDFVEVIDQYVRSCDVMLVVIGTRWISITDDDGRRRLDDSADFVRREIEAALQRGIRVIPILVDGAPMPRSEQLPPSLVTLSRRQAVVLSPERFQDDTDRLLPFLDKTVSQEKSRRHPEDQT
jgi:hypothetical protein